MVQSGCDIACVYVNGNNFLLSNYTIHNDDAIAANVHWGYADHSYSLPNNEHDFVGFQIDPTSNPTYANKVFFGVRINETSPELLMRAGLYTAVAVDYNNVDIKSLNSVALHAPNNVVVLGGDGIQIVSNNSKSAKYFADYSADFTARSLIDKGFSDATYRPKLTAPSATSDTKGTVGDTAADATYFYIKTSAGWKRYALSNFSSF